MKLPRNIVYQTRKTWEEYGEAASYIQTATERVRRSGHDGQWSALYIANEAWYLTSTILLDFSEQIFFENDYYRETLKRMPTSIANSVYALVRLFLWNIDEMDNVQQMICHHLHENPLIKRLQSFPKSTVPLCFYPTNEYFQNSDFVHWNEITDGFKSENVIRVMRMLRDAPVERRSNVAYSILNQANAFRLYKKMTQSEYDALEALLSIYQINQSGVSPVAMAENGAKDEATNLRLQLANAQGQIAEYKEATQRLKVEYEKRIAEKDELIKRYELNTSNNKETESSDDRISLSEIEQRILDEESEEQRNKMIEALLALFANAEDGRWAKHHSKIKSTLKKRKKAATKPTNYYAPGAIHDDKRQQMFLEGAVDKNKLLGQKDE